MNYWKWSLSIFKRMLKGICKGIKNDYVERYIFYYIICFSLFICLFIYCFGMSNLFLFLVIEVSSFLLFMSYGVFKETHKSKENVKKLGGVLEDGN